MSPFVENLWEPFSQQISYVIYGALFILIVVYKYHIISNEGSNLGKALESDLKNKEALIITYWRSYEEHENSHKSDKFQPLFQKVIDLCENGNEEIVYDMLWQGEAYTPEMAKMAQSAKEENS